MSEGGFFWLASQQQQEEKRSQAQGTGLGSQIRNGGELLLRALQGKDVNFVFGTTGAGMAEIQDAMVIIKPPKWIQGLHEFVTVNAAAGYALASEGPAVSLIDRVVGTANAAGAFYCAYMNTAPVVVLASLNVPAVTVPTGQIEYHYIQNDSLIVNPWIKWSARVESLETLPDDLSKGFYMVLAEEQGPVYISVRQDLMAQKLPAGQGNSLLEKSVSKTMPVPALRILDDATVQKICDEILNYSMPEIAVSHLGRHKASLKSLVNFAHTFGLGVNDLRSFMNFPTNDSLHAGFTQETKPPELMPKVDLVLALEMGLLPNKVFPGNPDAIDLTSDPFHRQDVNGGGDYGSTLFPALVRGVCDVGPTLDKICKCAAERISSKDKETIKDRSDKVAEYHNKLFGEARKEAEASLNSEKLDAGSIGLIMNNHWSNHFIWVDGTITPRKKLLKLVTMIEPGSYFSNPAFHLGAVTGMAYGVALANRKYVDVIQKEQKYSIGKISTDKARPVICTTGDGDAIFGNIASALWTCSHYGIGVLYIILNNSCWGIEWPPIEKAPEKWAKNAGDFEFLDLDNPSISFSEIARGFNVASEKVQTPAEFQRAFIKGIQLASQNRPMLIDARLEKETGPKESVVP